MSLEIFAKLVPVDQLQIIGRDLKNVEIRLNDIEILILHFMLLL